jgi:superfamily I DNA/RNA helicase
VLAKFADISKEVKFVLERAKAAAKISPVAILVRDRYDAAQFTKLLTKGEFTSLDRELSRWPPPSGLSVGTYHSAKGLEFATVFMPLLSPVYVPSASLVKAYGGQSAAEADAKLIYVGITRARQSLILTYSGQRTPLLPDRPLLYDLQTR